MGFLNRLIAVAVTATSLLSTTFETTMPQLNVNGTLFLINRDHMISADYEPTVRAAKVKGSVRNMRDDAANALEEMFEAAKQEENIRLVSVSGYRSYARQKAIYNRKLRTTGSAKKANEYVALPGASEHQLGLAMDVGTTSNTGLSPSFGNTKGGKWVAANCHRFGFIVRYQQGWETITGYKAEPWHIRYVGKEYAKAIYESQKPLETYIKDLQIATLIAMIENR